LLLVAAALIGTGSSVFHPESSRVARMASGGKHGLAQSVFQVGGNLGTSAGPLLAAFVVLPHGQSSVAWFSLAALLGIVLLINVGHWYKTHGVTRLAHAAGSQASRAPRGHVVLAITVLLALVFSKYVYLASLTSYYTFYLIDHFHVSVRHAHLQLFVFLAAAAAGGMIGGPLGDRLGSKYIIWASILGVLPFTLLLPHANLFWTCVLTVPIGLILSSAFPAIVVYAQDLLPGRTGMVAGLFFGLAFDAAGRVTARYGLGDGTGAIAYETPPAAWHTLVPGPEGGAFLEIKQGPYDPATSSEFADWAPAEGHAAVPGFLEWLRRAQPGDTPPG